MAGRKPCSAGDSTKPEPGTFDTITLPARITCKQARHADGRVGAQFHRIAEGVVQAPQQHVHAFEPGEGLEVQLVVAHREVLALDERHAEIAREKCVLEEGLAEWPGREERDVRRALAATCVARPPSTSEAMRRE